MKIKVEGTIRLQFDDTTVEISHEEARELMARLSQVLGQPQRYQPLVPVPSVASIKQKVWVYPRN